MSSHALSSFNPGFRQMFAPGKLTLGLLFPIEAYKTDVPTLERQAERAAMADSGGFAGLWCRDIPLRDPQFGDVGQILDPWVWMTFMLQHIKRASLATGSLIVPLRHPIHLAKAASSLDMLSGGRMVLGLASGDRASEFPAFAVDHEQRAEQYRQGFEFVGRLLSETSPNIDSPLGRMQFLDMLPHPQHGRIGLGSTGMARQDGRWLVENSDFWLTHMRPLQQHEGVMLQLQGLVKQTLGEDAFKPIAQSMYLDLTDDPDSKPMPIYLGYRLGRNHLINLLEYLQELGVNHVAFVMKLSIRPVEDVLAELIEHVVPHFQANAV